MKSRSSVVLSLVLVLGLSALQGATSSSIKAPVLGHVLDLETGSLHRINGIPGASGIGEGLALEFVVRQATVASDQSFAIALDDAGRFLHVNLRVSPPRAVELEGALTTAEGVLISPSSNRVALYSAAAAAVQMIDTFGGEPRVGEILELPQDAGQWTAFALSDSGVVLAAAHRSGSSALYTLRPDFGVERIAALGRAAALAFFAGSNDVVFADAESNELVLIRDVVAKRESLVIASESDGVKNPVDVQVTSDGRFVAAALPGGVSSIPVFGGQPVFTSCICTTTDLLPLAGGNVFQLTADTREPMRIVRVGAESRVMFIPALKQDVPVLTQ